jgi:alkanesulfonate monooxygenase SsuD/methylene tetrahydromethanopterin reductase-like flavin-dependent oxidoreductase (luciferase family)
MFTPEMLAESLETVARHAREQGRTTTVSGGVYLFICVDRDGDRARKSIVESVGRGYRQDFSGLARYLVAGTPTECVERLHEYVEAGAKFLNLQLSGPEEVQETSLALLIESVLPGLRST